MLSHANAPALSSVGSSAAAAPITEPSRRVKIVVSLLATLHLLAVFTAPFAFASGGGASGSPLATGMMQLLRPYIAMMYLDHGYFFFAPAPGPSHLVRYKAEFADGRPAVEGVFPNLQEEQPRLLYHRYFMLSEALNNSYAPPEAPPEPTPPPINIPASSPQWRDYQRAKAEYPAQKAFWQLRRKQYETLAASIIDNLETKHPGSNVTLTRVEHRPATPVEVDEYRMRLSAPETYRDLPESASAAGAQQ